MIVSRSRAALRALSLVAVLAVSAACTLQVGGGGTPPSALGDLVGVNGLLADPAATRHRPSLEVTIDRAWAARLTGVALQRTPSAAVVDALVTQQDEPVRRDLEVRWAAYRGDSRAVGAAIGALGAECGGAKATGDDCAATVRSVWSFLSASDSPALEQLGDAFPDLTPPACPAATATVGDQFLATLCGRPVRDAAAFSSAVERVLGDDGLAFDSRTLWAAAVVSHRGGLRSEPLRAAVERSVGQSQAEGIFFDETPAQGTLLTSWALLHLAGPDRLGLDQAALAAAVRREATDGAADRVMLSRAGLALLGSTPAPPRGGRLALRDPDGPYNPFIALAARDAGDLDLVSVAFGAAQARTSPQRLASWVITRRIVEGRTVAVTAADVATIRRLVPAAADTSTGRAAASPVPGLLRDAALAAVGRTGAATPVSVGCQGAAWLVTVGDECDIRSSLLVALRAEFATPGGAS